MKKPKLQPKERRDAAIGIRTTRTIKAMADEAARAERRTVSQWVETLIIEALAKRK